MSQPLCPIVLATLALSLAASVGIAEDTTTVAQQVIFASNGRDWYRIPSLAVTPNGTVLAFASRRKGSASDFGHDSDVVLRRSTDNGRSFEPMQTLVSKEDVDIHHGPVVVDRASGRILKFCRYWPAKDNPQRFVATTPYQQMVELGYLDHFVFSDDEGETWSAPQPLELPYPADAVSCGTGNGNHGIQLSGGRLLIQGGFIPKSGSQAGNSHVCIFYSDDGGRSWQRGATTPHAAIREFALAELHDGAVYYNFRTKQAGVGHRAVSRGDARGLAFGEMRIDTQLPEPFSHAGLLRLTDPDSASADVLIFTNPNRSNTGGQHSAELRREMTVRISRDGGETWQVARTLNRDYASYSDLAQSADGSIHCLYENGTKTYRDQITHARFTLD